MKKTLLSWSSGKDSAWALYTLRNNPDIDVVGLFTVVNEKYDRASMHATQRELLQLQARATNLPIETINLPDPCTNEQCDEIMREFVEKAVNKGTDAMAFGDLYLEDVRQYRINQLKGSGIEPVFPLWGIPTCQLAETIISSGVETYISCVDLKKLPARFAGQKWNAELIAQLPAGIDPCGENGEFHTIVTAGPMFRTAVPVRIGEIVERNGFAFADIIPII